MTTTHPIPGIQQFTTGQRVRHCIYGTGTVVQPDKYTRADMCRIRFDSCGTVRVIASRLYLEQ